MGVGRTGEKYRVRGPKSKFDNTGDLVIVLGADKLCFASRPPGNPCAFQKQTRRCRISLLHLLHRPRTRQCSSHRDCKGVFTICFTRDLSGFRGSIYFRPNQAIPNGAPDPF